MEYAANWLKPVDGSLARSLFLMPLSGEERFLLVVSSSTFPLPFESKYTRNTKNYLIRLHLAVHAFQL